MIEELDNDPYELGLQHKPLTNASYDLNRAINIFAQHIGIIETHYKTKFSDSTITHITTFASKVIKGYESNITVQSKNRNLVMDALLDGHKVSNNSLQPGYIVLVADILGKPVICLYAKEGGIQQYEPDFDNETWYTI